MCGCGTHVIENEIVQQKNTTKMKLTQTVIMDKHSCHVSIQTLVLYSGLPAVLPETVSGVILANFIRFSGKKNDRFKSYQHTKGKNILCSSIAFRPDYCSWTHRGSN